MLLSTKYSLLTTIISIDVQLFFEKKKTFNGHCINTLRVSSFSGLTNIVRAFSL